MAEMGGLLGGGMGAGSGTAPIGFSGEPNDTTGFGEDREPNVSPEEQQQYDAFVKNAMQIMYRDDGQPEPEVLQRLSTGKKPIDTMAQTLVWLVMMVEQDAKRQGQMLDDAVVMHGASEIMEHLIDLSDAAGLHKWKQAEMQGAWYQALDMYAEANDSAEGGRFNKEEAAAEFAELQAADQEGRLDEVIPGFNQGTETAMAMAMQDGNKVDENGELIEEEEEEARG